MKRLILLILPLCFSITLFANGETEPDSTTTIIEKGQITIQMTDATHKMYEWDYRGALQIFREVLITDPSHPKAHFRIAQCHYALKAYDLALKYVARAEELDPEVDDELYYVYAQANHRLGMLDEAIEYFTKFKETLDEKKWDEYELDFQIAQCEFAKACLADTATVTIALLPGEANSRFDDKAPLFYGQNGDTLFITSRRSDGGGARDEGSDFGYFENIFMSVKNTETGEWGRAEMVEGKLNTDGHTAGTCFSPDGEYMYLTLNILGATGSSDIWWSKVSNSGKWGKPKPVTDKFSVKRVNSSYYESSASVTGDGETMYFVSERPDGQGQADIYKATRVGARDWSEPVNLGPVVNSFGDENTVWVTADEQYLFFCSNGHMGMGGYDIFRCTNNNGTWSEPVNLGAPINSVNDEAYFTIGPDGMGYFCTMKTDGLGERDIYTIDLTEYDVLSPTLGE